MAPWPLEDHSGSWQPGLGVSFSPVASPAAPASRCSFGAAIRTRVKTMPSGPSVWTLQAPQQSKAESPPVSDAGMAAAVVARHTTAPPFDDTVDRPAPEPSVVVPERPLRERVRRPLMVAFPIMLAAVGAGEYLAREPYVSTDDAFVRAAKESVNARVAGQVVEIAVKDNQRVQRGQLLFQVDPEPS